jgi:sigma-B regulation protein RsbU (phosphoserine phosphatase)
VISSRSGLLAEDDVEPELQQARHVAIMPIATRQRLVGALEVWEDTGPGGFDSSSIRLFEALALQAAHVVEGDRAHQGTLERERLRSEIEIGGRIQETLLWDRLPPRLRGVQIASFAKPSHVIDGDFCEFFPLGDRCLDIVIGDVMGKGVPAALIGAAVKSGLLRALGQLTVSSLATQRPEPRSVVGAVHDHLTGHLIALESFVSLSYNRFDFEHKRLDFVSCGHPRTMHAHAGTATVDLLEGPNLPLGVLDNEVYEQRSVEFEAGDVFLLYSDGVTEARNATGEQFGEGRLIAWLTAHQTRDPVALCAGVWDAVRAFTGSDEVSDDLTCVAVRVTSLDPGAPAICWAIEFTSNLGILSALRAWVRAACHADRTPDSHALALLELAVAEAATNIIRHAYEGAAGRPVRAVVEVEDGKATVTLTHWGRPFQPPPGPPAPPDPSGERGRGLFIISHAVDDVTYQNCPNGASSIRLVTHLGLSIQGGDRMLVTTVQRENVAVVSIADGSLDASNAKRFKQEVIPAIESTSKVVIDLSGVEFVDSSGLGVLLSCYRQVVSAGGDLKLCGMAPAVRALFELVRMHRIFDTYPTREEAIAAFRPS